MIVAERKPFEEIKAMLDGCQKILTVGCGTCVAVCMAGGEKEVEILASMLRIDAKKEGRQIEVEEACVQRQCDQEYLEPLKEKVEDYDVILSLACGAGVQFMAENFPSMRVLPALNTRFIGVTEQEGQWSERCAACGDCVLELTEGICPIARCSKSLLNGPCGGSAEGKCEIDPDVECAWQLICDRLERLGRLEKLEEVIPARDWSSNRDGGPRKVVREDAAK